MVAIAPELRIARGALPKRELSRFASAAIPLEGELSVLLTTDAEMQQLNLSFRNKNTPTDVLSFPAAPYEGGPRLAGDLALSIETAQRQAAEFGHSLMEEVEILLLHGLLHLAGFDHETDSGRMARRERLLRKQFALPLGLIQRAAREPAAKAAAL